MRRLILSACLAATLLVGSVTPANACCPSLQSSKSSQADRPKQPVRDAARKVRETARACAFVTVLGVAIGVARVGDCIRSVLPERTASTCEGCEGLREVETSSP
jgi:hypothetical protein